MLAKHFHLTVINKGSSKNYNPEFLLDQDDIIFVSINYRLGIFGFLNLNTPEISGNQGLKDQQIALKWIHTNIEAFGGDKKRITLFGFSAGICKSIHFQN